MTEKRWPTLKHWLTRFDPSDGKPYGVVCDCEIGEDHDGDGNLMALMCDCASVAPAIPAMEDGQLPDCITQDPREPAHRDYLAICAIRATEIADSIHCPPECGGHPVCKPCLALGVERGLVVRLGHCD